MSKHLTILATLVVVLAAQLMPAFAFPINKSIYGSDDRYDAEKHPDHLLRGLSNSVAGLVASYALNEDEHGFYRFFNITFKQKRNLCDSEPFGNQRVLPSCTGFLIAEDILLTAGHCVEFCISDRWVFDYKSCVEKISPDNIYSCKRIIERKLTKSKDYAIVQLDRPAKNREPLRLNLKGSPTPSTSIAVIGHPNKLPLKIAANARIAKVSSRTFTSNLDASEGSSGSPVVNEKTGEVIGILIEGKGSLVEDEEKGCFTSQNFPAEDSGGVVSFNVKAIKRLKRLIKN